MLGVFACKRAAASLGGENPTGTRRRRHDYRSLPSSDGCCQSFRSGDENERDAGGRQREERDPNSGGIWERVAERWNEEVGGCSTGDGGESMTYAEVGSVRDSAQFPASLANDQGPEGDWKLSRQWLFSLSSNLRSFLNLRIPTNKPLIPKSTRINWESFLKSSTITKL